MHGNDKRNPNLHHLYDIYRVSSRDTYKSGVSDDPIEEDGLSARVRDQLEEFNSVAEYHKFEAEILLTDIAGRAEALRIERAYIDAYYAAHGHNPKGNKYPVRK